MTGKELRSRAFTLNPNFSYLPDPDRYLMARERPRHRFNVIGGRERPGAPPHHPVGRARHHPRDLTIPTPAASLGAQRAYKRFVPQGAWSSMTRWKRPAMTRQWMD